MQPFQGLCSSTVGIHIDLAAEPDKDSEDQSDVEIGEADDLDQGSEEEPEDIPDIVLDSLRDLSALEEWTVSDNEDVPVPGAAVLLAHFRLQPTVWPKVDSYTLPTTILFQLFKFLAHPQFFLATLRSFAARFACSFSVSQWLLFCPDQRRDLDSRV